LFFPTNNDFVLYYNGGLVKMGTNILSSLYNTLPSIAAGSTISSVFNQRDNELWVNVNGRIYIFNFDDNTWSGGISSSTYKYMANATINGVSKVFVDTYYTGSARLYALKSLLGDGAFTSYSVSKSVTVYLNISEAVDFVDLYVYASVKPNSIQLSNSVTKANGNLTLVNPATIASAKIKLIEPGVFEAKIPRDSTGIRLNNTGVYIRINYLASDLFNLKYLKVGFKPIK
jgi:hypothetical protein